VSRIKGAIGKTARTGNACNIARQQAVNRTRGGAIQKESKCGVGVRRTRTAWALLRPGRAGPQEQARPACQLTCRRALPPRCLPSRRRQRPGAPLSTEGCSLSRPATQRRQVRGWWHAGWQQAERGGVVPLETRARVQTKEWGGGGKEEGERKRDETRKNATQVARVRHRAAESQAHKGAFLRESRTWLEERGGTEGRGIGRGQFGWAHVQTTRVARRKRRTPSRANRQASISRTCTCSDRFHAASSGAVRARVGGREKMEQGRTKVQCACDTQVSIKSGMRWLTPCPRAKKLPIGPVH